MPIGKALQNARKQCGDSQTNLSMEANCSRETISAYENGRAKVPSDIFQHALEKYQDLDMVMEAAADYFGPYFFPQLNGDNVDHHPSSVLMKSEEELEEALVAVKKAKKIMLKPGSSISDVERRELEEIAQEYIESMTCGWVFLRALEPYGLHYTKLLENHNREMIAKGYVVR
ncbi:MULTISPECIES: helix-turn-helix domain-containing protein [Pontibacillus]|uniref:Helix-turn-helix transcriptional regulator n=1 Tax=Pontibacillus chungwhensis TaxID=265426 RepID=A0ABY8UZD9_9BACI|nr:helix-turn-helix transcriptional regulator [Pontibacillus chungwhensis]MCD5324746.1 helix-turn-helix domain-containing protein [Pontibacillus sp. HN14]WIF98705.1 helix-turn-helix transcriptional regulator [Pontibacillus chungwhensis]